MNVQHSAVIINADGRQFVRDSNDSDFKFLLLKWILLQWDKLQILFTFFAQPLHFILTCHCISLFSAYEKDFALAVYPHFHGLRCTRAGRRHAAAA
jgi:hypothetical protein